MTCNSHDWDQPQDAALTKAAEITRLPVDPETPALATVLLYNATWRTSEKLSRDAAIIPPSSDQVLKVIIAEKTLAVSDLLRPETHATCELLSAATPISPTRLRHIYRRSYLSELATHQKIYFDFFESGGVPLHILQCLEAYCDQERLIDSLEQLVRESSKS